MSIAVTNAIRIAHHPMTKISDTMTTKKMVFMTYARRCLLHLLANGDLPRGLGPNADMPGGDTEALETHLVLAEDALDLCPQIVRDVEVVGRLVAEIAVCAEKRIVQTEWRS